jgi:hypothetical protein
VFNNAVLPSANITKHRVHSLWVVSNYECFKLSAGEGVVKVKAFSTLPRVVLKTRGILDDKRYAQTRNNGIGIVDF